MSEARSAPADGKEGAGGAWTASAAPTQTTRPRITWVAWYALALLTCFNLFCYMDRVALAILMQAIKADLHLSDAQLGLLTGIAFAAFYSVLGLPVAWLADHTARTRLLSICLAIWSLMTALGGMARSFSLLFLARMGVGVGEAGCIPSAHSLIGDYFPRERRAFAISIFQIGSALGVSGGLIIVGALGQHMGWRSAMITVGLAGLPLALLAVLTLREPPRPMTGGAANESMVNAFGALLRRPALLHLALAISLNSICTYGLTQWAPSFVIRSFGLSMAQAGAWLGGVILVSGVLGLLTGGMLSTWLVTRNPKWELWLPAIACSIATPLYSLMFLSPNVGMALGLQVCANYVNASATGVALAAVQSFAEPYRRGAAIALVLFFSNLLGGGLGPYLIGLSSDLLAPVVGKESLRYALLLSCAMMAWAVIHFLLAAQRSTKDHVN